VTHATGLLSLLAEHSKDRMKIVVVENGRIDHVGSYDEIMSLGLDVTSISRADLKKVEEGKEEDEIDAPKLEKTSSSRSTTNSTPRAQDRNKDQKSRKLIRDEDRAVGHVKLAVWKHFFVTFGFKYTAIFMISAFCSGGAKLANGFWLAAWMDSGDHDKQTYFTVVYAALQMTSVFFVIAWIVDLAFGRYHMSIVIHRKSLWGVFRSPMVYFDSTRLGRIINRFSSDLSSVDTELCWNVILFINSILGMSFSLS
jgi:ATP-binding cassette, subfamily C (CFTR/MRP), member 1